MYQSLLSTSRPQLRLMSQIRTVCVSASLSRRLGAQANRRAHTMSPLQKYYRLAQEQHIQLDDVQLQALVPLEQLFTHLQEYRPMEVAMYDAHVRHKCRKAQQQRVQAAVAFHEQQQKDLYEFVDEEKASKLLTEPDIDRRLLDEDLDAKAVALPQLRQQPKGVYLWGAVGCGKSMLMDLFYEAAPVEDGRKLRIHFHSFMRDVLQQLHRLNTYCSPSLKNRYDNNLVQLVAKNIAQQAYLVCFDEMQIPDVGTAGILYRLFKHLDEYGVVVVATSNRAPADLYQGHFRETLFDPFVQVLEDRLHVERLMSETDYRVKMADHLQHQGRGDLFGDPCYVGPDADDKLDATWEMMTHGQRKRPSAVHVFGRSVTIPESIESGTARFSFKELCAAPLGPADYLAIARTFHTIFIRGIPRLNMARRNEARRLISLIDALYECHTKVYCSMEIQSDMLFVDVGDTEHDRFEIMHGEMLGEMLYDMGAERAAEGDIYKHALFTGEEEVFASKRCISRLHEMRSAAYWSLQHDGAAGLAGIDASALEMDEAEANSELYGGHHRGPDPLHDTRDKPIFSAKHFWGAGWWEKIRERARGGGQARAVRRPEPSMHE